MAHSTPHSLAAAAGFVSPALSQRAMTFAAIVGFHIVLVYFLASGLASSTMKLILQPMDASIIKDVPQPDDALLPPPTPTLQQPDVVDLGPVPDGIREPASDGEGTQITGITSTDPPVKVVPPVHVEPIHLVGKHQMPNTEDYYPPSEIRLGHQGATIVNVCVNESGKRQGEPTVTESSGNARLDQSAIEVARNGRYARSARGDTFVPNCYGFRIVFTIR